MTRSQKQGGKNLRGSKNSRNTLDQQNYSPGGTLAFFPQDHATDCVFVKIVARYAILANTTFHERLASITAEVVNDYHEGGRPDLPTLAEDGTVKDVVISATQFLLRPNKFPYAATQVRSR